METTRGFWPESVEVLAAQVSARAVSARELTDRALEQIERTDPRINAFVAIDAAGARRQAAAIDERLARGEVVGPLAGIPIGVKDLEDAAGFVTTFGSALRSADAPATRDSVLVGRLRAAGCVVLGKTNTPEHGHKGVTDNPVFGATANPWNPAFSSGGSSGGSAAALAAGMVPLATGSDGGGSIRLPGALCGLSAIKTSQGRIAVADGRPPGSGLLSVVGPMTRRVRDAAYVLDAVVGPHPADPFAHPAPAGSWRAAVDGRPPEAVVWSPTLGYGTTDPEVVAACESAVATLEAAGTRVVRVDDVFDSDPLWPWLTLWVVARYRAQGHLIDTPDWDRLSASIQPQIRAGAKATAVDVAAAVDAIYVLATRLEEVFATHAPFVLCPTIAGHPPLVGSELGEVCGEPTPAWVKYTPFANMSRNPAGSVCVGRSSHGIPIGLQVVGRQLDDVGVLRTMAAIEDLVAFDAAPPL
jgi:Asp-tRNA(Asn)/Glu-tRNA(Gln) amidotransferase A subunit family amidase